MPPDRGSVSKTHKSEIKTERKVSTPKKEKKAGDLSNGVSSKSKQDSKVKNNLPLSRQRSKIKEESMTVPSNEKLLESSKIDAAKLKDVKKDLDRDLKNVRETLARNRAIKNSTYTPTATRTSVSERTSEASIGSRTSKGSTGNRKVLVTPSSSKRAQQTFSKSKTDLSKEAVSSSRSRLGTNVTRQESVNSKNKGKELVHDKQPKKLSRERTRTRTLSPHEVKMAKGMPSLDVQSSKSSKELHGSASTLAAIPSTSDLTSTHRSAFGEPVNQTESVDDAADNYEDDFEDYESDFEDDVPEDSNSLSEMASESEKSSKDESDASTDEEVLELMNRPAVEEEKKLDSGNYDLTESKQKRREVQQVIEMGSNDIADNKRKGREIQQIKEALEKENADISVSGTTKQTSLARQSSIARDEGFDEEKSEESKTSQELKNVVFINFANAKKKMEQQKVTAKTRKRGEELLSMIRLDSVGFSLLDLPPVPYEVYMKSFGRSNTQQASVQTNEDNLSEEIQTEELLTKNKWTQYPVAYHPVVNKNDLDTSLLVFSQSHSGSGGDCEEDPELWKKLIKYNAVRLNQFLLCSGKAIMQHLERQSLKQENNLLLNSATSSFSTGFFNLDVNSIPFLAGRSVSMLCFSDFQHTTMLTVHSQPNNSLDVIDAVLGRCMLCVWNILKPSTPEQILVCSNNVTSVCFHQSAQNLVFGGLCEGTVCVWDLQEPAANHCLGDRVADGWIIRSPTYSTAEILKNEGHLTEVTAVCAIGSSAPESSTMTSDLTPIQVCSVELSGVAIIWTVIQSMGNGIKSGLAQQDLGLAYWGKVRLVRSVVINVFEGLDLNSSFLLNVECRDMLTNPVDPSHFYVCTNSGHVIHCLSSGCKPHPKVYSSSEGGFSSATCIENMGDYHYMLVGCEGGIIQLYCRNSCNTLATYAGTGDVLGQGPSILSIQSSATHPAQFFILDKMSRIHVWNLTESDIVPVKSLTLGKNILSMKLSKASGSNPIYLAIAMSNGDVELHQMKPEFCYKSSTAFEEELESFRAYAKEL